MNPRPTTPEEAGPWLQNHMMDAFEVTYQGRGQVYDRMGQGQTDPRYVPVCRPTKP
jgi:hypothetical protein